MNRVVKCLILCVAALLTLNVSARALSLETFRGLPDRKPAVRESYGVREAYPVSGDTVEAVLGMSVTGAAENPAAFRIISYDDPAYAYERFVRPAAVRVEKILEAEGVRGSPFGVFNRTVVRLTLPEPMRKGAVYYVMAQGVGQEMVTGARTASGFTYNGVPAASRRDPGVDQAVIGLRAVEPVGDGILLAEFGPGYVPEAGLSPDAWSVSVNGRPVEVKNLGRLSSVDAYLPAGWPFTAIPRHEIFLQIDHAFRSGDRIRLVCADHLTAGARTAEMVFDETRSLSGALKVNQVGYLPDAPVKLAYLGRWMGSFPEKLKAGTAASTGGSMKNAFAAALAGDATAPVADDTAAGPALWFDTPPEFIVRDAESDKEVFRGRTRLVHRSGELNEGVHNVDHSGENVYHIDFSGLDRTGRYYISVPGVGRSHAFRIAPDVYGEAFAVAAKGVFTQRCGIELTPPYSEWRRIACHDDGIIPTTMSRMYGEHHHIKKLPEYVDYRSLGDLPMPDSVAALNRDPALLAYWPLDGDFSDASGNGYDLTPLRDNQTFEPVKELLPGRNLVLGPSMAGLPNGGQVGELLPDPAAGFTLAGWFKLPGGIKFGGTLLGHTNANVHISRIQVTAGWGVIRGQASHQEDILDAGRLSDGKWHHIALVAEPDGEAGRVLFYIDGEVRDMTAYRPAADFPATPFAVGLFSGDEAGGKFVDDVRVYGRPLNADEVGVLATRWGDQAIAIRTLGGHHDAGDYNPRSHIEVAQILMNAYEMDAGRFHDGQLNIPERGNGIPDILDEARWAMQLWFGLQREDGAMRGGTESNGDPNFIQSVELDLLGDYAFDYEPGATFELAGVFAQAARIWRSLGRDDEADGLLERAEKAYRWARKNPLQNAETPEQYARFYASPMAYAAAELLHTTGNTTYRDDFAEVAVWSTKPDAELAQHRLYDQSLAAWAYVKCPVEAADPELQALIRTAIIRQADLFIEHCSTMAYRFIRHPWAPITWGSGAYQNWLDTLLWSYSLTGDPVYRQWIIHTCDNTLGANPLGLCYITGLGERTVRAPLHNSRYSHLGEVAPGMQAQGPNQRGEGYRVEETAYPPLRENFANLYTFVDTHFAIAMNEGTVVPQARTMAVFGLLAPGADGASYEPVRIPGGDGE